MRALMSFAGDTALFFLQLSDGVRLAQSRQLD